MYWKFCELQKFRNLCLSVFEFLEFDIVISRFYFIEKLVSEPHIIAHNFLHFSK